MRVFLRPTRIISAACRVLSACPGPSVETADREQAEAAIRQVVFLESDGVRRFHRWMGQHESENSP